MKGSIIIWGLSILLFSCGKIPTSESNQLFEHFNGSFEQGNINDFHLLVPDTLVNTRIVTKPIRKGKYALKNTLRQNDYINNGYRVELAIYNCAKYKTNAYYGFSIFIDSAYSNYEYNLICQWQDLPNYLQGEDWNSSPILHGSPPPIACVYVNGAIELKMNENPSKNNQTILLGKSQIINKAQWYDLAFHIFWNDDNSAFVEAKINGVFITPFNGTDNKYYKRNLFSRVGNYFKFGQYRGKDKTINANTIYFDEVKVGSSFNEVEP